MLVETCSHIEAHGGTHPEDGGSRRNVVQRHVPELSQIGAAMHKFQQFQAVPSDHVSYCSSLMW